MLFRSTTQGISFRVLAFRLAVNGFFNEFASSLIFDCSSFVNDANGCNPLFEDLLLARFTVFQMCA